ncbi:MAG: response regulator transcription factor [Candidatus Ornithospirochaeta sp.]
MERAALLLSLASLVIVSMDLSLSVVLSKRKEEAWAKWNIVLCATLLGMSVFFTYKLLSGFLFTGFPKEILDFIFEVIFIADTSFVIVFLCRFVNWLIARPMTKLEIASTFIVGVVYLMVSVAAAFLRIVVLDQIQAFIPVLNISYCIIVIVKNYKSIENRLVKNVAMVFCIISLSIVPLLVVCSIWVSSRSLVFSVSELAYYIMYLTFMYIALEKAEKASARRNGEPTLEDFSAFHITEREFDVIKLIRKGMTNKEIGFELGISVNTVNNHIANIFQKTGVRSRIDLLNVLEEALW